MTEEGLVTIPCRRSVADVIGHLEAALQAKGITIFTRVDHAAGAATVGMELRPTSVLIFGNPKTGTPLMQSKQTIGIDLPLKMLAWQDASGQTWLSYADMRRLARRHRLGGETEKPVAAIADLLAALAKDAAA